MADGNKVAGGMSLVLGTMTFGWDKASTPVDDAAAAAQIDYFVSQGCAEIDSARMYAGGKTEELLGRVLQGGREKTVETLATKVNPWGAGLPGGGFKHAGAGGLAPEVARAQLDECLRAMKMESVAILYLHAPDSETAIEGTLEAINEMHKEGKFKALGLSNFQSWEVAHIYHTCKANGWVLPTVYQGMYNAITREVERELFPCLRKLGIRFLAYNPLAAGVLTGKHRGKTVSGGRFEGNKMYQDRYWKATYLDLDECAKECETAGITMTSASLRWLLMHSRLDASKGDGIVLGASSQSHLEENVAACMVQGPLPDAVVAAYEAAWTNCMADCPSYERGYSKI